MTEDVMKKLHDEQMTLLHELNRLCESNSITYYLIAGSALGAVRHHGFIPWDVDIDVAMMRDDYARFIKTCDDGALGEGFHLDTLKDKNHLSPHALLTNNGTEVKYVSEKNSDVMHKLYLDIFPLDEIPADECLKEEHQKAIMRIKKRYSLKRSVGIQKSFHGKNWIYSLGRWLVSPFVYTINLTSEYKKLDTLAQQYNGCGSGIVCSITSGYSYEKQSMPFDFYGNPKKMWFEDGYYNVPEKTEDYLKHLYADYMKIPSDSEIDRQYNLIYQINFSDGSEYISEDKT